MPSPARSGGRSPTWLYVVALTTVLSFGCTTVRSPVSGIGPTVPVHGSTAEPQVELWLESGGDLRPEESARAAADAREALRQALQDRKLGEDDVLVVRAQAVSRTRSRRTDQHAAIAGIVVGAVVLVVLAVVVSGGKGGPGRVAGGHAGRVAGGFRPGAVPRSGGGFHPGAVPAPPRVPWPPPPPRPIAPPRVPGGVDVDVQVAVGPGGDGSPPVEVVAVEPVQWTDSPPPSPPAPAAERISAVTLPAPSPLSPETRRFFDGDWLRLELVVVDARTGTVRWTKTVTDEVDVRDPRKVRRAIDDALAREDGWYAPWAVVR
jgi:hypothetical protein